MVIGPNDADQQLRLIDDMYREDNIPDDENEVVWRRGVEGAKFREHFFWRYTDEKFMPSCVKHGWTEKALMEGCQGLLHYLHILELAGLLRPSEGGNRWIDQIMQDPFDTVDSHTGRFCLCRLSMIPLSRVRSVDAEKGPCRVRHGCHPLTLAAILEAAGPKGSREEGHEYVVAGTYTCEEAELTPLSYASRAIISGPDDRDYNFMSESDYNNRPFAQFILSGRETKAAAELLAADKKYTRNMGSERQRIYPDDNHIMWDTLQVWIGIAPQNRGEHQASYRAAPAYDGTRRTTRLVKTSKMDRGVLEWYKA